MEALFTEVEIRSLLNKVKVFNNEIGEYQLFAINHSFDYVIKLTNGSIFVTVEELEANTNDRLSSETLKNIAERFISKGESSTSNKKTLIHWSAKKVQLSFLIIFLMFLSGFLVYKFYPQKQNETHPAEPTETAIRKEEKAHPIQYLDVNTYWEVDRYGNLMINAIIENTAKQTNYKDILIKIIIKDLDGKTIYEQPFPLDAIL